MYCVSLYTNLLCMERRNRRKRQILVVAMYAKLYTILMHHWRHNIILSWINGKKIICMIEMNLFKSLFIPHINQWTVCQFVQILLHKRKGKRDKINSSCIFNICKVVCVCCITGSTNGLESINDKNNIWYERNLFCQVTRVAKLARLWLQDRLLRGAAIWASHIITRGELSETYNISKYYQYDCHEHQIKVKVDCRNMLQTKLIFLLA